MPKSKALVVSKPARPQLSAAEKALNKLGLHRPIDFALHLPIRYEDETKITRLEDALDGDMAQIEGEITSCEVVIRARRQLVAVLNDATDVCQLRFLNFYPSQQKQLAVGNKIRARGELRGGMFGWQMVHPVCKAAGGALPSALTPVYSTVAGLPQPYLRKAVVNGLARADSSGALDETIPEQILSKISHHPAWNMRDSLSFLHYPAADVTLAQFEDRTHPAWPQN
jgi:ATP-dependent DNA helicase RecG